MSIALVYSALPRTPASLFIAVFPLKACVLIYFMCLSVFPACVSVLHAHAWYLQRTENMGEKRTWKLQMPVNCHVDTRNRNQNLWESKCFQPLIDLSSPTINILSINSGFPIISGLTTGISEDFSCIPPQQSYKDSS